ncbi:hypothetical protein CAEBREN_29135 [Caenorhabditis brenneri]|uniref:Uncharacterized protein n=1 Tax=Caenorhabditis brenneri TaxID=135651 RepID=G0PFS5_CAEBE|nr:hypothetical protein CAEBREN_29135 [Caenorhabditis brenneri]
MRLAFCMEYYHVAQFQIDLISPSLFSLHESGNKLEKATSLKSLLGSGMTAQDSQNFLDLLVEATGVAEAVEDAEQKLIDAQRQKDDAMGRGPDGQPLYFTKENITERFPSEAKKIELFEQLDKTYSLEQLKDMNQTGYTVLTPKQMQMIYGKKSPFKNPKLLKTYNNMTRAQIHRTIHSTIRNVADEKLKFEVTCSKGIICYIYFAETRTKIEKKPTKFLKGSEKLKKLRSMKSYEASKSAEYRNKSRKSKLEKSSSSSSSLYNDEWVGSFKTVRRVKRSMKIKVADSYTLKSEYDKSPFATITKHLTNTVKVLKRKDKFSKWQDISNEFK